MRMAGQAAPHELFANVVDAGVRVDLDLVGAFGALDAARYLIQPGRNDERVVSARTDTRAVLAAGHGGPQQRRAIVVGPVNVDHRIVLGRGGSFKRAPLHRASRDEERGAEQDRRTVAAHWSDAGAAGWPALIPGWPAPSAVDAAGEAG